MGLTFGLAARQSGAIVAPEEDPEMSVLAPGFVSLAATTRRRWLAAAGASTTAFLAACGATAGPGGAALIARRERWQRHPR